MHLKHNVFTPQGHCIAFIMHIPLSLLLIALAKFLKTAYLVSANFNVFSIIIDNNS